MIIIKEWQHTQDLLKFVGSFFCTIPYHSIKLAFVSMLMIMWQEIFLCKKKEVPINRRFVCCDISQWEGVRVILKTNAKSRIHIKNLFRNILLVLLQRFQLFIQFKEDQQPKIKTQTQTQFTFTKFNRKKLEIIFCMFLQFLNKSHNYCLLFQSTLLLNMCKIW